MLVCALAAVSFATGCSTGGYEDMSLGYTEYTYYFEGYTVGAFTGDDVVESTKQIAEEAIENRILSLSPSIRMTVFSKSHVLDNRVIEATDATSAENPSTLNGFYNPAGSVSYTTELINIQQLIAHPDDGSVITIDYSINLAEAQALVYSYEPWIEDLNVGYSSFETLRYAPGKIPADVTVSGTSDGQAWELHCNQDMYCLIKTEQWM